MERMSLKEKRGWKLIFSRLKGVELGFEDPEVCREIKWIMAKAVIIKGNKKCNEKNRFRVGFLTENPPHTHLTIVFPRIGTTERKFVITEVPQKDICPHGRTYPRKAVTIVARKIVIPDIHVSLILNEFMFIAFKMCK